MTSPPHTPTTQAPHAIGERTLEVFADSPRINAWMYSKFRAHVRGTVLEVGSGIGNLSQWLVPDCEHAVLTDVEPSYVRRLQARFGSTPEVEVARFELGREPPPSVARHRYDAILAINVIEHVRDDEAAVRTLAGLLKPGGHLLVYVPACQFAFGTLDEALGHFRRYSASTLDALLARAGLVAEGVHYMNLLGLAGWIWNGRVRRARALHPAQVRWFEHVVGVVGTVEAILPPPVGLGVTTCARMPG